MMMLGCALLAVAFGYDAKDLRGEQLVEVDPTGDLHHVLHQAAASDFKTDPVSLAEIQEKTKAVAEDDGDSEGDEDEPASQYMWPSILEGDYPYMCICDSLGRCPDDAQVPKCYEMSAWGVAL